MSKHCHVCNKDTTRDVQHIKKTTIFQCSDCGSYFADPVPTKDELAEMYENTTMNEDAGAERLDKNGELIIPDWKDQEVKTNIAILNEVRGKRSTLLDVGCFWGIFLLYLQPDKAYKTTGLEIWDPALDFLKKKKVPVIKGTLETITTKEQYDMLTMFDVLEHVSDLDAALQKIHQLLTKDGLFMITVPNADGLWPWLLHSIKQRFVRNGWDPLPYPFHTHYYTPKGLKAAFERNNFKVVVCKTASTHDAVEKVRKLPWIKRTTIVAFSILGGWLNRGDRLIMIAQKA